MSRRASFIDRRGVEYIFDPKLSDLTTKPAPKPKGKSGGYHRRHHR
jgi:hypothetical protein